MTTTFKGCDRELCQLATDWRGGVPDGGTWGEIKVDGIRALYIRGELVTREGAMIHGTAHIVAALARLEREAGEAMVFDGEFQVGGSFDATLSHLGRRDRASDAGTLHLFDCLTLTEWQAGGTDTPLVERKARLVALVAADAAARAGDPLSWEYEGSERGSVGRPLTVVEDRWLVDQADVEQAAREVWAAGGEGLMLKDASGGYRRNRSSDWRKVKSTLRLRLKVEAVICRDDAPGHAVALAVTLAGKRVRVPLRATLGERERIFASQFSMVGSLAIVEAMERTATGALRQPRFVGMA